ncbi:MAG: nucleotide exchange factor GrpE [Candidatus Goldbacteria bacterium]|nr:nucleotide exchange factor GrpE [Candidatus Goldiibacteriota bacterium]
MEKEMKNEQKKEQENGTTDKSKEKNEAGEKIDEKIVQEQKKYDEIIAEKDKKIYELTDKYLRALAELDNYRKRVAKEKQEFEKNTKNEVISIFLPIFDNLERAFASLETATDVNSLKAGIEMIIKQFKDTLKEMGVKEIETKGIFNPDFHHALHKEYVEGKSEGEILEVYQKGYLLDNRIIRPAMVKVACEKEEKKDSDTEKN